MNKIRINGKHLLVYLLGHVILAFGIALNTKVIYGVSPIISVPYSISQVTGWDIGTLTFILYCLMIFGQFLLSDGIFDRLQWTQILVSLLSSYLMQFFSGMITVSTDFVWQLLCLLTAIVITAIGASLTVAMKMIPNPVDGLSFAVGLKLKKDFGAGKNLLDIISITTACLIGLIYRGSLIGIGWTTFASMILTGRVLSLVHPYSERIYKHLA